MDALTALGLACNIIKFVQFAGKLIASSQEAFESIDGSSRQNAYLENMSSDFVTMHQQLLKDVRATSSHRLSSAEQNLQRLVEESVEVAGKSIGTLRGLKGGGGEAMEEREAGAC